MRTPVAAPVGFRHEALFYREDEELASAAAAFVREGLEAGEQAMVAMPRDHCELVRAALGDDASGVRFVDMEATGRNPARIIPAWRAFVDEAAPSAVRGIGEPVWAGRSEDELLECDVHERLVNLAFRDQLNFRLLCPYRVTLDEGVLEQACATHPKLVRDGEVSVSGRYRPPEADDALLDGPLPEAPGRPPRRAFGPDGLADLRQWVERFARDERLPADRTSDLVLAAHEIAANSVLHGGGGGILRSWRVASALVVEIGDSGRIDDPLAGRIEPADEESGRGLWLANRLCDLVQLRSSLSGTVVRLHMTLPRGY